MRQSVFIRLSIMMFLEFFIWGSWAVTISNYMNASGMSSVIGWAFSVGPIAALVSPFFLGMIADRFFSSERVLGVLTLLGGVAMFLLPFSAQYGPGAFIGVLLFHMLCYMPTLGLTNTVAFHNLTSQEKQFPLIRVFGTAGWIAANIVISKVLKGDTSPVQFYLTGAACMVLGLFSFGLPHTPPPAKGQKVSARSILGLDALAMLKQPAFAVFIISSLLVCIPLAAYYAFASVYVKTVGFAAPAATMSFGQGAEVIFMVLMPLFFAYLGVKWMLLLGMLAWAARYALFAAAFDGAGGNHIMWMVVLGILLHGICYDFFFVTGFIYTDKKANKEIRAQAQGFLVLLTQGIGGLLGAQIVGRIVGAYTPAKAVELDGQVGELTKQAWGATGDKATALFNKAADVAQQMNLLRDWTHIWIIPAAMAAVVMVLFFLFFRDNGTAKEAPVEAKAEVAAAKA